MARKREIWAIDSETDPFKAGRIPRPFIWGAYNGSEYHQFDRTKDLVEFLAGRDCLAFAHNGGKFDWFFLFPYMEPESDVTVIAGRLAKFRIGRCEFRDSYNIMPMPLSAYKKDEIDYSIMERHKRRIPENRRKIEEYLRSDCLYLFEMLSAFIEEFGLHLTQAGASMKAWEKIAETKAPQTSALLYETVAPFYYGGRVQCFTPGVHSLKFAVVDINSAYPYAMTHLHPYGNVWQEGKTLPRSEPHLQRAFITLDADSTGAFPYRAPDKSLSFPDDGERRTFHVTGWEYIAARDTDALKNAEVRSVLTVPESIEFRSYLDHFYKMKTRAKQEGDRARYEFAKRFLNSLYGKFGANPENYSEYKLIEQQYIEAAAEADGYEFCAVAGKYALVSPPLAPGRRRYYHAGVAASITGFVRAYLWRALCTVERPLYCDTDAIACATPTGLDLDPERLGAWDVEAECDLAAIAGKKLYAFRTLAGKWKSASKGVRLEPEQIVQIARGAAITYKPDAPQFSLSRGIRFNNRQIRRTG